MIFKRALQRYGTTPPPETPFSRAGQVWDERIGSARSQARNWRLMALGCLGLNCALSAGLLWQSMQSRVTPYVVAVDRLGEASAITAAEKDYTPTDPQIAWALGRFIRNVRGISLDPVLMRADWLEAYDFTTRRGRLFLDGYARAADPFADIGQRTVAVQVTSVVRASDRSFQIKWTETAYERGAETGISHWTGIVTVLVKPPVNAETLRKNPLGLYVDAVDWSRELETPQSRATALPPPLTAQTPPAAMTPTPPVGAAPVAPINQEIQ